MLLLWGIFGVIFAFWFVWVWRFSLGGVVLCWAYVCFEAGILAALLVFLGGFFWFFVGFLWCGVFWVVMHGRLCWLFWWGFGCI